MAIIEVNVYRSTIIPVLHDSLIATSIVYYKQFRVRETVGSNLSIDLKSNINL